MRQNFGTVIALVVLFIGSTIGIVDGAINLISNPGFESGTTSWNFYTSGTGTFTTPSPGYEGNYAARLALSSGGSNIQLYQTGVTLEANTRYNLSFAAYSNTGEDMKVLLFKHSLPYTAYAPDFEANLNTSWQTFTTEFNTTGFSGTVNDGRLMFYLSPFAAAGDTYYVDAIILEKVGADTLEARLAALEANMMAHMAGMAALKAENTALKNLLANVSRNGNDIYIDGANLHIRDGSGDTFGPVNGLGNLIIGYNEPRGSGDNRTGSHNLVLGSKNNYGSYGGLNVGFNNEISGPYASVSGGSYNKASGEYSSVSGGQSNKASGKSSSVSGGGDPCYFDYCWLWGNDASGEMSSISGGNRNTASGWMSSVSGGAYNKASGPYSSVSGGASNTASGESSSVSGGSSNTPSGIFASVSGGSSNNASGMGASVSGGLQRNATGIYDWVAGGLFQDQ